MPKSYPLTIVIPVYNEGDNFPSLYKSVKKNIKTPHKMVVIYDFDEDNTVPVVKKIAKKDKSLILHKNNLGRGALNAVKSGIYSVKNGPCLVTMADLSDDLSNVDIMYQKYLSGSKVVCASRYMKGGKQIGGPFLKRKLSRLAGVSLYYIKRIPTHDVTNNFKLYDSIIFKNIVIESTAGFEVAMEITVKAFKNGYEISEIPTTWMDREAGESNFKLWKWLPAYLRWYIYALFKSSKKERVAQ